MRRGWVVISCGWQCDVPEIAGLYRHAGARGARRGRAARSAAASTPSSRPRRRSPTSSSPTAATSPYRAADLEERDALLTVRDQPDGPADDDPARALALRARATAAASSPTRATSTSTAASRRAGSTRSPTPPRARPCWGSPWRRCATAVSWLKHGGAAEGNPAPGALRWAYAYGRSQTGRLLRTLALRGPQPRRGGARGARRDHRQRRGRDAGRVQPALRPELEGPQQHDGAPLPVHRPARHRSRHGDEGRAPRPARRARQPAARLLHEHLGRVPPRRRLAAPHRPRRHARRGATAPTCASITSRARSTASASGRPATSSSRPPTPPAPVDKSQNLRGVVDYSALLRACLVNLDRWVTEGVEPPPSRHPRLADGTAVPPDRLAPAFARIPAAQLPAPSCAAPPSRLVHAAAPRRARLRLPRLRGGRRRQRDRRASSCPRSRCRSPPTPAGRCAIPTSAAPSSSWSSPAPPCPSRAPARSARRRATRALRRGALRLARGVSRAGAAGARCPRRERLSPGGGRALSVAAAARLWDHFTRCAIEGGKHLYRIKCATEVFERVVREAQLADKA